MGIYDRDYYRDEPDWNAWDGSRTGATAGWTMVQRLIALNALVFLVQAMTHDRYSGHPGVTPHLWLDSTKPWELWRLLTADFCHSLGGIWHIAFNMLVLWCAGERLEARLGGREFLAFYLAAGVFSSMLFLAWHLGWGVHARAVGASGAVMGVFAAYALWNPRDKWLLFFFIPVEARWLLLGFAIWDLSPMLVSLANGELTPSVDPFTGAHIAYMGHVGGLLFGVLYYAMGARLTALSLPGAREGGAPRAPAGGRDWQPEVLERKAATDLDRDVDRILAKIASAGEESLTDDERRTLEEASRQYREKQER